MSKGHELTIKIDIFIFYSLLLTISRGALGRGGGGSDGKGGFSSGGG